MPQPPALRAAEGVIASLTERAERAEGELARLRALTDEQVDRVSKRYYECSGAERPVGNHTRDWMRSALETLFDDAR